MNFVGGCPVLPLRQQQLRKQHQQYQLGMQDAKTEVAEFVGALPVLPPRLEKENQKQQRWKETPKQQLGNLPSCLRATFRRSQQDKRRSLLDNGEGKSVRVSFADVVNFERRGRRQISTHDTPSATTREALRNASRVSSNQYSRSGISQPECMSTTPSDTSRTDYPGTATKSPADG